ncbi:apolipoprotein L3-like [Octodon degus]|uniref:Apolipoprotein L3-like n=1 Tax=Octodon degus TaxID=10160 RepID=A0A6P3FD56_OCTDE|nr:apolipoprotein L3-like [Octodon degus]
MDFIEEVIECILNVMSPDELQKLVAYDKVWKMFTEEAGLSRDEAKKLYDYLKKFAANSTTEDKKRFQEEIRAGKQLLKVAPKVKAEIESCSQKLCALAERVDKVHKGCTVSSVVTSSVGAASGVMNILGLTLAPFTAGGSLLLSAAGTGLGVVTAVSGITTTTVEHLDKSLAKAEAELILSTSEDNLKRLLGFSGKIILKLSENIMKFKMKMEDLVKTIHALRRAQDNCALARNAIRFTTTGGLSANRAAEVQRAFGDTPLSMTKGARIGGAVLEGLSLGMNVYFIVKDSMHLHEGAKAPLAEKLRQKAQEMKQAFVALNEILQFCC